MLLITRFIKGWFNSLLLWDEKILAFWVCKRFWNKTVHWNVLRTLHNPKKQPPRNVRIAVLKNSKKFPRSLFHFLLLKALRHGWFPGNSLKVSRTAVLRNTSGRLLLRLSGETVVTVFCSTDAVARKYLAL